MPEVKPCISELYKAGKLNMELVNKIAHNELDKYKDYMRSSVYALAVENIDGYTDPRCREIIENFVDTLDNQLHAEDFRGGTSPEVTLGAALARGAESHARADIEYFDQEFISRAITELNDIAWSIPNNLNDKDQAEQGLDEICDAKGAEANLIADGDEVAVDEVSVEK